VVELELLYSLSMLHLIACSHSASTFGTFMPFLMATVLCRFRSSSSWLYRFSYIDCECS